MRFLTLGTLLLSSASIAIAASSSNCSPISADNKGNPVNQIDWSSASTSSTDYESNLQGIGNENHLGALQIEEFASNLSDSTQCNTSIPTAENATDYLLTAYILETEVSGAFTGLANFTQAPEVSLLLNWLAVQHGTHATYIATTVLPNVFEPNGTSSIPVLPPKLLLSNTEDSILGAILGGCLEEPDAPCTADETADETGDETMDETMDETTTYSDSSDYVPYPTAGDSGDGGIVPPVMPDASGISDMTARAMWKEQTTPTTKC